MDTSEQTTHMDLDAYFVCSIFVLSSSFLINKHRPRPFWNLHLSSCVTRIWHAPGKVNVYKSCRICTFVIKVHIFWEGHKIYELYKKSNFLYIRDMGTTKILLVYFFLPNCCFDFLNDFVKHIYFWGRF